MLAAGLGQRQSWRLEMWCPPPVYTGKSLFPQSSEGHGRGTSWLRPAVSTIPECTVASALCQPLKLLLFFLPAFGSHGFWSILKRLCHYWPGRQAACSRATTHSCPILSLCKWRTSGMLTPAPYCSSSFKRSVLLPTPTSAAILMRNDNLL